MEGVSKLTKWVITLSRPSQTRAVPNGRQASRGSLRKKETTHLPQAPITHRTIRARTITLELTSQVISRMAAVR